MPEGATRAMTARHGIDMPAGNEAAGIVVAAGDSPAAQALMEYLRGEEAREIMRGVGLEPCI